MKALAKWQLDEDKMWNEISKSRGSQKESFALFSFSSGTPKCREILSIYCSSEVIARAIAFAFSLSFPSTLVSFQQPLIKPS